MWSGLGARGRCALYTCRLTTPKSPLRGSATNVPGLVQVLVLDALGDIIGDLILAREEG